MSAVSIISLGLSPTGIDFSKLFLSVLNCKTSSHPQQLMYNCFLEEDKTQVYASPPKAKLSCIFLVARFTIYSWLFSLVTTYNLFLASSTAMPAGEILRDHFAPNLMLSSSRSFWF